VLAFALYACSVHYLLPLLPSLPAQPATPHVPSGRAHPTCCSLKLPALLKMRDSPSPKATEFSSHPGPAAVCMPYRGVLDLALRVDERFLPLFVRAVDGLPHFRHLALELAHQRFALRELLTPPARELERRVRWCERKPRGAAPWEAAVVAKVAVMEGGRGCCVHKQCLLKAPRT
jgi:hypothetical protein